MCDYSLHAVTSRPAKVADKLMTTVFPHTVTRGLASAEEPATAVCLLPGTEVAFDKQIELAHPLRVLNKLSPKLRFGKLDERTARFRQLNGGVPNMHHDALELPDGRCVMVTHLHPGQRLTVLQLPAEQSKRDQESRLTGYADLLVSC